MSRKCPICNEVMETECYLKDRGSVLSDFIIIRKDENYKKTEHIVKAAMCTHCGHIELYVDLKKE